MKTKDKTASRKSFQIIPYYKGGKLFRDGRSYAEKILEILEQLGCIGGKDDCLKNSTPSLLEGK